MNDLSICCKSKVLMFSQKQKFQNFSKGSKIFEFEKMFTSLEGIRYLLREYLFFSFLFNFKKKKKFE